MKFNLKKEESLLCSAGKSYLHIYPNGDVYRCMHFASNFSPICSFKNFDKKIVEELNPKCPVTECNACCDVDWATKWIVSTDKNYKIEAGELEKRYGVQDYKNMYTNRVYAVWSPSLLCNYQCSYCHFGPDQNKLKEIKSATPELTKEEWIDGFEKFFQCYEYGHIAVTGGEPFLKIDIIQEVINISPEKFVFDFTTNLSFPIVEFSRNINPKKISIINCSMHPSVRNFSFEQFAGRVLMLKNNGFNVKVNFVGYPEQMFLFDHYKEFFGKNNIPIDLIPFIGISRDGKASGYSIKEYEYMKKNNIKGIRDPSTQFNTNEIFNIEFGDEKEFEFCNIDNNDSGNILYLFNSNKDPIFYLHKSGMKLKFYWHENPNIWHCHEESITLKEDTTISVDDSDLRVGNIYFPLERSEEVEYISNKNPKESQSINTCLKVKS